jgi:hypothetical protein
MNPPRSLLLNGFSLLLAAPGALLWTYALNLSLALAFSLRVHAQLSAILSHSLAAERLTSAFDLGTLTAVVERLNTNVPSTGGTAFLGLPFYLLGYFILVPGTLVCFQSSGPSSLQNLVSSGLAFFWRFVRITLLTLVASAILLGPLLFLQARWFSHVDDTLNGRAALLNELPGIILIALVAALIRLYFDLVEVYTVQLGARFLSNGRPDRRIRRTLLPALRTLRANIFRAYGSFLALTLLGVAAVVFTGRIAAHMLAQPRVWPMFLLAQAGLFVMLATRFWQRGAETMLASDFPIPHLTPTAFPEQPPAMPPPPPLRLPGDAQPDPEPAVPSLPEPDPGVFHHDPGVKDHGQP